MKQGRVRLLRTLKCGENIWEKGMELISPLPPDILTEIKLETGMVEVLEGLEEVVIGNVQMTATIGEPKPRIRRR
jgi:hypothetical protein